VVLAILEKFPKIEFKDQGWPRHLLEVKDDLEVASLTAPIGLAIQRLKQLKKDLKDQLLRGGDPVSLTREALFRKPAAHKPRELSRARERRDRGNPPGKGGKLGDQLNWEQLLSQVEAGRRRLWLVSRDGDYGVFSDGRGVLHELLLDDLRRVSKNAEAYLFNDLGQGLDAFIAKRGV